jgi:release factor glutamine methyltransferase
MKLKEVFEKSVQFFKEKKIDTARLDAEILISHALKIDRVQLYMKYEQPLKDSEVSVCREFIRRRSMGEPVAYIIEEKGFYKEIFKVGPGVLIPRPETEAIVEEALDFIKKNNLQRPHILDLGAGSGCIGLSILKNCPDAILVSIEKSEKAFSYLKENLENLKLVERAQIYLQDVNQFDFSQQSSFDIIVANPPYIDVEDTNIEKNVKAYEPAEALFASEQGLSYLKQWSNRTAQHLNQPGLMLFEMGYKQGSQTKKYFEDLNLFSQVHIIKDLSELDRIIKSIR